MAAGLRRLRALALCAVCSALAGCAVPFYWQAIGGQLELLRKRTPIDSLLADPRTDASLKTTLRAVSEMRRFAVDDLGLPDNDSYTSYADLGRQYVVWNVIATEEFSIEPERWCFPFAGCVAYRGFFHRAKAERFRARLDRRGLDTYLAGATAYSTLGFFADPILSTMLGGGYEEVASVLFHELAHQRLYIRDDSELSEAFATAVEEYGTELWLRDDTGALARYRVAVRRRAEFSGLVAKQQARLQQVYSSDDSVQAKRAAKARAFDAMRADYAVLKAQWGGIGDYDPWFAQPLNNAALASVATYRRWLPGLRRRLDALGVQGFYAEMEQLAELPADERAERLTAWLDAVSAARALPQAG